MGYRIYLDGEFKPTPPARATLVKVVRDDGSMAFYRPRSANVAKAYNPDEARDEAGKWTGGGEGVPTSEQTHVHSNPKMVAQSVAFWNDVYKEFPTERIANHVDGVASGENDWFRNLDLAKTAVAENSKNSRGLFSNAVYEKNLERLNSIIKKHGEVTGNMQKALLKANPNHDERGRFAAGGGGGKGGGKETPSHADINIVVNGQPVTVRYLETMDAAIARTNAEQKPAPTVAQKEEPNGIKASERIRLETSIKPKTQAAINEAKSAIDSVHGIDAKVDMADVVPFGTTQRGKRGWMGVYYDTLSRIEIRDSAEHPSMTFAHEYGHHLDFKGGLDSGSREEIIRAARATESFQKLQALKLKGSITVDITQPGGNAVKVKVGVPFRALNYLTSDREVIARSYAQYVTMKSGNAKMMNELNGTLKSESANKYLHVPTQWGHAEFSSVSAAFDKAFKSKGWIK